MTELVLKKSQEKNILEIYENGRGWTFKTSKHNSLMDLGLVRIYRSNSYVCLTELGNQVAKTLKEQKDNTND